MLESHRRPWFTILALLILALAGLQFARILLDLHQAWLQHELVTTASYVWNQPTTETHADRLAKVWHWGAVDPQNERAQRARPLSDAVEVLDAIARPFLSSALFPHPSLTPFAVLTAVLCPILFFGFLRESDFDPGRAALLTAVFVSSIAFLSVHVSYIRAAKKLSLLFLCLVLYFGQRHARTHSPFAFWGLIGSIFVSFFADELGLANWVIAGLLFLPSLVLRARLWQRLILAGLPLLYVATILGVLRPFYTWVSAGRWGAWDPFRSSKTAVFGYLGDPELYQWSLAHTARAFLTTLGVWLHAPWTELIAVLLLAVAFVGASVLLLPWLRRGGELVSAAYRLLAATVLLFLVGFYVTLLDSYPSPENLVERSYLGSYTYYYHAPLGVLGVVWLACAWSLGRHIRFPGDQARRALACVTPILLVVLTTLNFHVFHSLNQVVRILHTIPYDQQSVHEAIARAARSQASSSVPSAMQVVILKDYDAMFNEFEAHSRFLFHDQWNSNAFYFWLNELLRKHTWTEDVVAGLVHIHHPEATISLTVHDIESERYPVDRSRFPRESAAERDSTRKQDIRAIQTALQAYFRQHGRYPCPGTNDWQWSEANRSWIRDRPGTCGATRTVMFGPPFLESVPADPINVGQNFWSSAGHVYGYRGYQRGCPPEKNGKFFVLGAQLENKDDPDGRRKILDCTGQPFAWPDGVFAVSSDD